MSTHFALERTWGAEILPGGRARFRLWAPAHEILSLVAMASGETQEMLRAEDGWFELSTDLVKPGDSYMFQLPDGMRVPDPAARAQEGDVHGPSQLIDPRAYDWQTGDWRGRPWEEAVIYELHPGTFSPEGDFAGIEAKLDDLARLGVTGVELLPVAQFSGNRGWGYDGVLMYAPHLAYGGPDALKRLVDAAHARGLMMFLDVVYNHFGPDGNYLNAYVPDFFDPSRHTPWGAAIAYERDPVRGYFIENALYWLEEYRFDGLRLDAVDQIRDDSLLADIATTVRQRITDRHVHLTTEDDRNVTFLTERVDGAPKLYSGEWNDDFHHAAHVIAVGEADGYYRDYSDAPVAKLARSLTEGYIYQGEPSPFRDGEKRGEPSAGLTPSAFVDFLQNHDQAGNRAFGERLSTLAAPEAIEALTAVLLLGPQTPLLFMGEEWGETRPFLYFTDFHGELAQQVRDGRRNEFRKWRLFADPEARERIPDPNALSTFEASKLDWSETARSPHRERLALVSRLLKSRREAIVPLIAGITGNAGTVLAADACGLGVAWRLGDTPACGGSLMMFANLSDSDWSVPSELKECAEGGKLIYETVAGDAGLQAGTLPAWSVVVRIVETP
ncbi:MAG TPA: malto-oligosyltrehalose trehalohydrolase [Methyloceanibacter sp.]|nr:malto-oligosyltrehalose trehalohydrolase [Methyloceanibacter sp.]